MVGVTVIRHQRAERELVGILAAERYRERFDGRIMEPGCKCDDQAGVESSGERGGNWLAGRQAAPDRILQAATERPAELGLTPLFGCFRRDRPELQPGEVSLPKLHRLAGQELVDVAHQTFSAR